MATFRIITATKKADDTLDSVEALLAKAYPDWRVENLVEEDGEWKARIVQAAEPPAFLKKDDKDDAPEDAPEDDSSEDVEDDDDDSDSDSEDDNTDKGDKKDKGKSKDPVAEVKKIMDELQGLLSDLGGKTQELQNAHDEKADKLKDIADTVGDDGATPPGLGPDAEVTPDEIGPTPQGSPIPPIPKRPGVPGGGAPVPGRPSAFSNRRAPRRTEIATHPGVDRLGRKITLTAAMAELEADPQFKNYEIVQTRQEGNKYVAKLQLKQQ